MEQYDPYQQQPKDAFEEQEPGQNYGQDYEQEYGQEPYGEEPIFRDPPKRKKKKRSKVRRFFRALGLYIAELPAKTLIIVGGSVAVVLIAVILLAVLLPKNGTTGKDDPQIKLTDQLPSPTASLEPITTPEPSDPTPEPSPEFTEKLVQGMTSDFVPGIQERLIELGYMEVPKDGISNYYGPNTKFAIRIFQQRNITDYKEWDGVCGPTTYALLMDDAAQAFYLKRNDKDADFQTQFRPNYKPVSDLQTRLMALQYFAGPVSGTYDAATVNAVQKFQEDNNLKADGWAGAMTLAAINDPNAVDAVTAKLRTPAPTQTPPPGT